MLDITMIAIICGVVGTIFGTLGMILSIMALIKCYAAEKSTHSLQYVPIDKEIDKANEEFLAKTEKENTWATTPQSLEEQQKLFTEDLEEQMPEFLPDDKDKELYSF